MAKKKTTTDNMARALEIVQALLNNGNVTDADRNFVKRLYSGNSQFGNWFDDNVGEIVTLSKGRVKDAKDAYRFFGFTPRPRDKDVAKGTQEMLTRSGKVTNQTGAWSDVELEESKLGNKTTYKATPNGGRTRTTGEVEAILRRGNAGTKKMSLEDQRIYDKLMAEKQAKAEAEQRARANAALEQQRRADRAAKLQQLGIKDDGTLNDNQIAELLARREAEFKTNEEIRKAQEIENIKARAKAEEAAAEEAKWRAANNIDPDDVVSDFERAQIKSGDKAWGYRPEDQRAIDDLEARLAEIYRGTSASEEDRANLSNQLEAYKGRVKKGLIDNPNGLTAEQAFGKTYLDENGVRWGVKDGMAVKLSEPKQDAEDKGLERQQKIADDENNYRRKWFDDHITELMKPKKGMVKDDTSETGFSEGLIPGLSYEEAYNQAVKDRDMRFAETVHENGHDICPECGAPLDENGVCTNPECGYGKTPPDTETPVIAAQPAAQPQGHIKSSYL